jgi:hypothetical protein
MWQKMSYSEVVTMNPWVAEGLAANHRQGLMAKAEVGRLAGRGRRYKAEEMLGWMLVRAGRRLIGPVAEAAPLSPLPTMALPRARGREGRATGPAWRAPEAALLLARRLRLRSS